MQKKIYTCINNTFKNKLMNIYLDINICYLFIYICYLYIYFICYFYKYIIFDRIAKTVLLLN